jgi:diguanylate cyclase (GGDEF)-like protein/PAS domain S-box-containing protein
MVDRPRPFGSVRASAKTIYPLVAFFVGIVFCLLVLHLMRAEILDTIGAYVAGKSLWSKERKNAAQQLMQYAVSHDEADYRAFLNTIASPALQDHRSRLEPARPEPGVERASGHLAASEDSLEEAKAIAAFLHRYRRFDDVAQASVVWAEANRQIAELILLGDRLHEALSGKASTAERILAIQNELAATNRRLISLEEEFSRSLSEAVRRVNAVFQQLIYAGGGLLLAWGAFISLKVAKSLRSAEAAARESDERFRLLAEGVKDCAIFMLDPDGRVTSWGAGAEAIKGYRADEIIGQPFSRFYTREDIEHHAPQKALVAAAAHGRVEEEGWRVRKDGSRFWANVIITALYDEGGRLRGFAKVIRDVTERVLGEQRLRQFAAVFESTAEGVIITDADAKIIAVNKAFTIITGYSEQEVLRRNPRSFRSGRHGSDFYRNMWKSIREKGGWQGEIWDRRKNGEIYPKWLTISIIRNRVGQIINYIGVFSDLSQLKRSEEQLARLAHYDPLTGLPNRLLLNSRLPHALEQAKRHGWKAILFFLDLDRFKTVNDSLGHPAGDELLVAVAQRIRNLLRDEDTLARLGGDEFVILLENLNHYQAAAFAQRFLATLTEPFRLASGHEVFVSASIGISIFPDDARDSTQLVRNADAAMFQAKQSGRSTYRFYTEELTHSANQRLDLESRLRRALERKEFILHYQPQIDIATGRIIGVEALVRWQSPELGLIPPARFIPLAEETGFIVALGEWVLRSACSQTKAWLEQGLPPLTVAVNFSSLQFHRSDMAERIRTILDETGLPADRLELEITESATLERGEHAQTTLQALKALGVRLAIDDFGTGYSSLAYLKRFAFDTVKIDRSFVRDLCESQSDGKIVAAVIAMARNLRLTALAEGVESEEQLAFLRKLGCDTYQGYLFSRPRPAEEIAALLNGYRSKSSFSPEKASLTYAASLYE